MSTNSGVIYYAKPRDEPFFSAIFDAIVAGIDTAFLEQVMGGINKSITYFVKAPGIGPASILSATVDIGLALN